MTRTAIPARVKRDVLAAYGNACAWCRGGGPLDLDHKVPVALGGVNNPDNLWPLCKDCHRQKTTGRTIGEKLSSDVYGIAKAKRVAKKWNAPRPEGSIKSRGFDKTLRKKMNGTVERREG